MREEQEWKGFEGMDEIRTAMEELSEKMVMEEHGQKGTEVRRGMQDASCCC